MTIIIKRPTTCTLCATRNEVPAVQSTTTFGSCDLDLRDPPLARDLTACLLHRCQGCGYVAADLADAGEAQGVDVRAPGYRECLDDARFPQSARNYRARAWIEHGRKRPGDVAELLLRAAWLCDDTDGAEDAARQCRDEALQAIDALHAIGGRLSEDPHLDELLRLDLLRRSGRHAEVRGLAETLQGETLSPLDAAIAGFHWHRAGAGDAGCYTVREAEEAGLAVGEGGSGR